MGNRVQSVIDYCNKKTFKIGQLDYMEQTTILRDVLNKYQNEVIGADELAKLLRDCGCPYGKGMVDSSDLCDPEEYRKFHEEPLPDELDYEKWAVVCDECWLKALEINT